MTVVIYLIISVVKEEFIMVLLAQQISIWEVMFFTGKLVMKIITRVCISTLYVLLEIHII